MKRLLAGAISAVLLALVAGACDDSPRYDHGYGYGGRMSGSPQCGQYASCGTCTPALGCGWCITGAGSGLCVDDLDFGNKRDYWMAAYQRTIEEGKPTQGVVRGPRVNKEHLVQYWLKLPLCRTGGAGVGMILCLDHFQSASEEEAFLPQATA